jgi:hypothetical protein
MLTVVEPAMQVGGSTAWAAWWCSFASITRPAVRYAQRVRAVAFAGAIVATAVLAAATVTAAPAAGTGSAMGCRVEGTAIAAVAHSHVLAARGQTVVYRVRGTADDVWWACRRGSAPRAQIGSTDSYQQGGSEYGPTHTLGRLTIAGAWVLAVSTTGLTGYASCTKYAGYPCPGPNKTLVVVDVHGSHPGPTRITRFSTGTTSDQGYGPYTNLSRVLLSSAGGLAWLVTTDAGTPSEPPPSLTLSGCALTDAASGPVCTPAQIDSSPAIDPTSLQLHGTTLTWLDGAVTNSTTLGPDMARERSSARPQALNVARRRSLAHHGDSATPA